MAVSVKLQLSRGACPLPVVPCNLVMYNDVCEQLGIQAADLDSTTCAPAAADSWGIFAARLHVLAVLADPRRRENETGDCAWS